MNDKMQEKLTKYFRKRIKRFRHEVNGRAHDLYDLTPESWDEIVALSDASFRHGYAVATAESIGYHTAVGSQPSIPPSIPSPKEPPF